MTSIESTTISGTYAVINSSGLPVGCCILNIINNSDEDVTVSYDGVTDHDYVPTLTDRNLYFQTNAQPNTNIARLAAGTKVYVKGSMGTGYIYLVGWYQPQAN
jgi:hypothetical protein